MEEDRQTVQNLLGPGETLLWMETAGGKNPLRQMTPILLPVGGFFGVFLIAMAWMFHGSGTERPDAPFLSRHFDLVALVFFGGFALFCLGGIYAALLWQLRATRYALTNRRLLTVLLLKQQATPSSIGLAEIVSVEAQRRGSDSGDLLLATTGSGARKRIFWRDIPQAQDAARRIQDAQAKFRAAPQTETQFVSSAAPNSGTRELKKSVQSTPLVGAFFAVPGLFFAGVGVYMTFFSGESIQFGGIFFVLFGLVFAAVGGGLILWREELTVDFALGTYRGRRGLLPKAQWFSGPLYDFGPVVMTQEQRSEGEGGSYTVWCAYATWRDGQRPRIRVYEGRDRMQTEIEAQNLAAQLRVPFEPAAAITPKRR